MLCARKFLLKPQGVNYDGRYRHSPTSLRPLIRQEGWAVAEGCGPDGDDVHRCIDCSERDEI